MNYLKHIDWFIRVENLNPQQRAEFDAWRVELWAPFEPEPLDSEDLHSFNGLVQEQEVAKSQG